MQENPIIKAWDDSSQVLRFAFLCELDNRYSDSLHGGLIILRMSMLKKLKEIEERDGTDAKRDG
jgi:hypothetical protein